MDSTDRRRPDPKVEDALDGVMEAALREMTQAPHPDLRSRVLERLQARADEGRRAGTFGWLDGLVALRPAAALIGIVVVLAGIFLTWRHANQDLDVAAGRVRPRPAVTARADSAAKLELRGTPGEELRATPGEKHGVTPGNALRARPVHQRRAGRSAGADEQLSRSVQMVDAATLAADVVSSNEPYLPGAPAGELGDPLAPLPSPPAISFAPISRAPTISDVTRPVTDFPADSQSPASPDGGPGRSGGTRR